MLIENDVVSASHITEMLKKVGHKVMLARDGSTLPEILREAQVDMVITDIFLDSTSGLQVVLDVKELAPGVKVLAISGGGRTLNFDYLDYALEFGADAVMRKPLEEARLMSLLERFAPSC